MKKKKKMDHVVSQLVNDQSYTHKIMYFMTLINSRLCLTTSTGLFDIDMEEVIR